MSEQRSVEGVEPGDELARLDVEGAGEAKHDGEGRVVVPGLHLRQVRDADRRPLGDRRLRESAPVPQLADPHAERAAHRLVRLVLRHDRIVRTPISGARAAGAATITGGPMTQTIVDESNRTFLVLRLAVAEDA